ncbi:MAG: amidohydrolase family protein [Sphingomonadaceae bacterium]|nr:amidohydrolase family protein [Sphingomonadaceae bacterium]
MTTDATERRDARNRWLAQTAEDIIEPDLPIIDPHHHLWPGTAHYQDGLYQIDEIAADVGSGHNILATVYIDAYANYAEDGQAEFRAVGETSHAHAVAEEAQRRGLKTQICAGIVTNADVTLDNAADVLDAHLAASSRVKGVRQIASFDATLPMSIARNPNLYDDPAFRRGFPLLAQRGLSFDACLYHFQLPQLTSLARAFPDTIIVADHLASPLGIGSYAGRREEAWAEWRPLIAELAQCPNVVIKLGGQGMWLADFGWTDRDVPPGSAEIAEVLGDRTRYAIDLFGPDRAMFESNFPVDRSSMSYAVLWNAAKRMSAGYTPGERAQLFEGTARRVYRL